MKSGLGQWLLVVGMSLLVAGSYLTWRSLRTGPLPAGDLPSVTEIRDDKPLPAFSLQGPRGAFGNANLVGQWNFMFFGYTQCPDICPTALTLMKDLKAAIAGKQGAPAPGFQVVFVSVDPQRDTIRLLAEYMAAFDPSFVGLSGTDAALLPLVRNLGVFYQRNDATDKRHYTVDHSAAIYLIDPQGRLAAVFSPPQQAARMAADFLRIARP
jgi:protein SCO1/2